MTDPNHAKKEKSFSALRELVDYYTLPDGRLVFTEHYLRERGYCCGNGCLHCPYDSEGNASSGSEKCFYFIQCPYCFESFGLTLHSEEGEQQSMVYDCEVCCRPIQLEVDFRGGEAAIEAKRYD